MAKKAKRAEDVIEEIESQARPVRGWSYVIVANGVRYLGGQTWSTRREVICTLEEETEHPWRELRKWGYEAVKVTTYEGWLGDS